MRLITLVYVIPGREGNNILCARVECVCVRRRYRLPGPPIVRWRRFVPRLCLLVMLLSVQKDCRTFTSRCARASRCAMQEDPESPTGTNTNLAVELEHAKNASRPSTNATTLQKLGLPGGLHGVARLSLRLWLATKSQTMLSVDALLAVTAGALSLENTCTVTPH